MTPEQIDSLKNDISTIVNDYWRKKSSPILLSALGSMKLGEISRTLKSHGVSLNDFISSYLGDEVLVYRDETNPIRIGAFPASEASEEGFAPQKFFETDSPSSQSVNRYNHAVWAAFRVPLPPKQKRYLCLADTISFRDLPLKVKNHPLSNGEIEVQRGYINSGDDGNVELVADAIQRWAKVSRVDEERLLVHTRQKRQRTIMNLLFETLTEHELAEVSMPLSVVKKLSAKVV